MIYILEAVNYYEDTWAITFYFVAALALLLGLLWTYYQVIIKGEKKKEPLKENIIYNNSEDVIENYDIELKRKKINDVQNTYKYKDNKENEDNNYSLKEHTQINNNNNNNNHKKKSNYNNYYKNKSSKQ